MMSWGHVPVAAAVTLAVGSIVHADPVQAFVAAGIATVTAAGPLSPDADQTWLGAPKVRKGQPWGKRVRIRVAQRFWPKSLRHRAPLGTHSVIWPILAAIPLWRAHVPFVLWGPWLGWVSHLIPADLIFGRAGYGRGPGIYIPFVGWVGAGFKADGITSAIVTVAVSIGIVFQCWKLVS
jgi:hypothetical protein